ncbi:MAG: nitrogen fixation protein NifH [Chloroflexi bacterium]|nr:MAG: nitrogen fixation protein NifH [Chloroflexota bacterium]MBL1193907.1 nitrogen fixation protein NifH [Chloroflexota bacterium]NOH11201.1 terpene cyclase/mutase family protein [Chloroflexota bacterium]
MQENELINWLLEIDKENPAVRYFALRDLLGRSKDNPEVCQARVDIMRQGPIPTILDAQHPDGYWAKPGGGHSPSYTVTVWQIIFLAEFGADPSDERVQKGCEYFLNHSTAANGAFAMNRPPVPSSVVHCLNGDPLYALLQLGYANDPRVQEALDWQVRAIVGEGELRYYKSGTAGPGFMCAYNQGQPCAWGATKAMKALSAVPPDQRTAGIRRAIETGADFLLSRDLTVADYPNTDHISTTWFRFGFPLSYRCDVLETVTVLVDLGYGKDPRLSNVPSFILDKQEDQGRWVMERSLNGKMWADIEEKGKPSKWITLRALRVLQSLV